MYSSSQKAIVGSNFTFQWKYEVANADKPNFEGITWGIKLYLGILDPLAHVSPSGALETSRAPATYKNRIMWNGNFSNFVASFVLLNVSSGDEKEYAIDISFGPLVGLSNYVKLNVLGK